MTRNIIGRNIIGAFFALLLSIGIMHESLELRFAPIIKNVRTVYISRTQDTVTFTLDFDKIRSGAGVQNSWWIDGPGNIGRYFQTPTNCGGAPLAAGAQAVGTHGHRELCMHIPMFLRDNPFVIGGVIGYSGPPTSYLGWRVPTPIPLIDVPAM